MTGSPKDVYEMPDYGAYIVNAVRAGSAMSFISIEANCHWSHVMKPQLTNNVQGNPIDIVGNASNERGEYFPVRILISSLCASASSQSSESKTCSLFHPWDLDADGGGCLILC